MDLTGKTAIDTGAGVRLGRAMALALAECGMRLVVHYHTSAGPTQEVVGPVMPSMCRWSHGTRGRSIQSTPLAMAFAAGQRMPYAGRLPLVFSHG